MKIIRQIFIDDILSLSKNFFALVIAIGICFLPALYAWFNIYSNWDPYGNTGALKMAVISEDKGYTTDEGEYKNQGDSIIENLHENTSVDWQFVDSADEAIEGVHSGKYYAAVVIDENFTYSMYNIFSDEAEDPTLHFYQNQKKNPVATKISDTVVSTLQNNINEAFIEVVISEVFSSASDMYGELQQDDETNTILEKLKELNKNLTGYEDTIKAIIASDKILVQNIESAKKDTEYLQKQSAVSAQSVAESNKSVAATQVTLKTYEGHVNECLNVISVNILDMKDAIQKAQLAEDYNEINECLSRVTKDIANIQEGKKAIQDAYAASKGITWPENPNIPINPNNPNIDSELKDVAELTSPEYESSIDEIVRIAGDIGLAVSGGSAKDAEEAIKIALDTLYQNTISLENSLNNTLIPEMDKAIDALEDVLTNSTDMLNMMSDTFGSTTTMFTALSASLESADVSLEKTNEALAYINEKLAVAIEKAESVDTEEQMKVLVDTLSGDPEMYGKFFSEPVEITTEAVYPVANYGSAVAPFYTTLAIWVGALILTAIIKVHPDKKKYPEASESHLYFGRLVLYLVLGQVQSVIIVLGDLYLLKIQCVEPGWFFLASACASLTFTILIYSLVVTWGDVGKALAVVIVVLQIAGSSGTYPIELLPEFFQKVYIFFPFPYAINAMRECTCGMYSNDYVIYLLQLGLFILVSFAIGLLLKIPFEELNHYMEERMEETEMM